VRVSPPLSAALPPLSFVDAPSACPGPLTLVTYTRAFSCRCAASSARASDTRLTFRTCKIHARMRASGRGSGLPRDASVNEATSETTGMRRRLGFYVWISSGKWREIVENRGNARNRKSIAQRAIRHVKHRRFERALPPSTQFHIIEICICNCEEGEIDDSHDSAHEKCPRKRPFLLALPPREIHDRSSASQVGMSRGKERRARDFARRASMRALVRACVSMHASYNADPTRAIVIRGTIRASEGESSSLGDLRG